MKCISSILTVSVLFSLLWTGCSIQPYQNAETETELPIEIATLPVETKSFADNSSVEQPVQEAETSAETAAAPEKQTPFYSTSIFDKAIFAALLKGAADGIYTNSFYVGDVDHDGGVEMVASIPYTEKTSANLIFDNYDSAGLYYYGATGIENDFFVLDPTAQKVYLNENTRSADGEAIISREYFEWQGKRWNSACMLYGSRCYWNYADTSEADFMSKVSALQSVQPAEDIFNLKINGKIDEITTQFYQYLTKYFHPETPLSVDLDGDNLADYVIPIQNLAGSWCSNLRNLYDTEGYFNEQGIRNVHTTCFILDTTSDGLVRIRSENFDRKYTFREIKMKLFAYDENEVMQTFQYSSEDSCVDKQFMSMVKMWD